MAGVVDGHVVVAVDRVAADEVVGEVHLVGVEARRLGVEAVVAEHRGRRGLARADRVDALDLAAVDQRDDLQRQVRLDVLAVVGVADLEAPAAVGHPAEERAIGARRTRQA